MSISNHASLSELPVERAEAYILSRLGERDEDKQAEVRAALCKAYGERGHLVRFGKKPSCPKAAPAKPCPLTVDAFLQRGAELIGSQSPGTYLAGVSPVPINPDHTPSLDAVVQLRAMFRPGDVVWGGTCGTQQWHERRNWGFARERDDWCSALASGEDIPPFVCINPVRQDYPRDPSNPPKASDIAVFRQCLFEADERPDGTPFPVEDQIRFLVGWRLQDFVCLTFSGCRSIHAIFTVDIATADEWCEKVQMTLFPRVFIPYGADNQCSDPSRKTRLGGAWRKDAKVPNGTRQMLLYSKEARL